MAEIREDVLSNRHLKVLQKILEAVADRWYSIGEALKIAKSKLDEYESSNLDNSKEGEFSFLHTFTLGSFKEG